LDRAVTEPSLVPTTGQPARAPGNLALSYRSACRTSRAIDVEERVFADHERLLGTEHRDTGTAGRAVRANRGEQ
jgi:hypothetical protein